MNKIETSWVDGETHKLGNALLRFGQIGFWVQFVFLVIGGLLGGYIVRIVGGGGFAIENTLAFLGLALPLFTTIWCRIYSKMGREMMGEDKPSPARVRSRIWIGVWVSAFGVIISLVSLFGASSTLLVTMLANPQVGIQVSAAAGGAAPYTISAIDAVSIFALLLTQTSELLVVTISLRLVFLFAKATRKETEL